MTLPTRDRRARNPYTGEPINPKVSVAKPNYNFEKRQRELKKAKKQEEKRLKKQGRNEAASAPDSAGSERS